MYHGSIMKYYRSIIKDSTMHEKNQFRYRKKLVLTSQKARLNITKYQEYCPKTSPHFGHSLPIVWALVAPLTGYRCPLYGQRMPV